MDLLERNRLLLSIARRCSDGAWDVLQSFSDHPKYEHVLFILGETPGAILESDVAKAWKCISATVDETAASPKVTGKTMH